MISLYEILEEGSLKGQTTDQWFAMQIHQWSTAVGKGMMAQRHGQYLGGDNGNVLHLNHDVCYITTYICQISSNFTVNFTVCEVYFNKMSSLQ